MRFNPPRLALLDSERRDCSAQLCHHDVFIVGLEDARLCLHHLCESPVRDAFPVRKRSALPPVREDATLLDGGEQLVDQTGLSDPRHARERDQLRGRLLADTNEHVAQQADLAFTADEWCSGRLNDVHTEPRARLLRFPDGNGLRLPFRLDRLGVAIFDRVPRRAVRRLADEDAVDRSGNLQARRGIHDVTRSHAFTGFRTRSEIDQCFPGVHRDPHLHLAVLTSPITDP